MSSNSKIKRKDHEQILLVHGYVRRTETKYKFYMNIPDGVTKTIFNFYGKIDILYLCTDFPKANGYDIPFVFKSRIDNKCTLYVGCEKYEIINNNQIKIHSPYPYIKETKQWYRIHAGDKGNVNGQMAGKHLSYILKLKYIRIPDGYYAHHIYPKEAEDNLIEMYYSGYSGSFIKRPKLVLNYYRKGTSWMDLPWIIMQTEDDYIMVVDSITN